MLLFSVFITFLQYLKNIMKRNAQNNVIKVHLKDKLPVRRSTVKTGSLWIDPAQCKYCKKREYLYLH